MGIFNRQKKITLYIIVAVVVGLIIAMLAWLYFAVMKPAGDGNQTNNTSSTVKTSEVVCTDSLIKEVDAAISGANLTNLQRLAGQVKSLQNYNQDPNCLYILLSERLRVSDASASRSYFNDLEPLARATNGFSQLFVLSSPSLDTLRNAVVALEGNQKQIDSQTDINNKSFQDLDAVDKANSSETQ